MTSRGPEPVRPRSHRASPGGIGPFELGTVALLVATLAVVGAGAMPTIARELGFSRMHVTKRGFAKGSPAGRAGLDAVDDFERGIGRSIQRLEDDDLPAPAHEQRVVVLKGEVAVRELPDRGAKTVGRIPKGTPVVVMREEGDWALVVHSLEDDLVVGWIARGDVGRP